MLANSVNDVSVSVNVITSPETTGVVLTVHVTTCTLNAGVGVTLRVKFNGLDARPAGMNPFRILQPVSRHPIASSVVTMS